MNAKQTQPTTNQINWKKAFLITLPLAALAIVAAALTPKPIITIAPYDGTTIRGARVNVLPATPVPESPGVDATAIPSAPPAPILPPEEAPLATGQVGTADANHAAQPRRRRVLRRRRDKLAPLARIRGR